jgi:hypothetical protein
MGKINKGILGGFNGKNLRQECLMMNAESLKTCGTCVKSIPR